MHFRLSLQQINIRLLQQVLLFANLSGYLPMKNRCFTVSGNMHRNERISVSLTRLEQEVELAGRERPGLNSFGPMVYGRCFLE